MFAQSWGSLCLLAGSLVGVGAIGLSEHPEIKAIPVSSSGEVRAG
jgi:mannose-binding lectin 2